MHSIDMVARYITQFQRAEENNRRVASFVAIPELQVPNADVSVRLTRTNSMRFLTPVDDPMFAAHQETILRDAADRFNRTLYYSDNPGTMLGCTEQYQFCLGSDINNETCTELSGRNFDATTANFPKANSLQLAIISLLSTAATFSTVMPEPYRIESEGTSSAGMVNEVPDDQWIKEVEGWNAISWAGHQIVLAEYAVGQSVRDPTAPDYTRPPNSAGEKSLCRMQKMRKAGGFVNINVFGLVFIVTISCVVTIVDITLLRFISLLKKIKNFDSPRLERWMQDGLWQLQRHAYEAHGAGVWKDLTDEVPTIAEYTELPDLPLQHSSLSRVSTYNDSVGMKSPRVKQKDTFNEKSDTEIAVSPK